MRSSIAAQVCGVSIALGGSVAVPVSASADEMSPNTAALSAGASIDEGVARTDREGAALAAAQPPSSCVDAVVEPRGIVTQTVQVTNGCAATQRVKVLAAFAPDSECFVLPRDTQVRFAIDIGWLDARFDRDGEHHPAREGVARRQGEVDLRVDVRAG